VEEIPNALARFQLVVGGYLEAIAIPDVPHLIALVDDEGALKPNPRLNMFSPWFGKRLFGTIAIIRVTEDGDFASLTEEDFDRLADHFTYPFHTTETE
jgi:hypothetical protein